PEVRTPLDDDRRGRRSARRNRDRDGQTAESRREARAERDRAYMGGGMVDPRGTTTNAPAATGTAGSGNQPGTGGTSQTR
ncbi:MAG: hypothetical protein ICV73_30565, partial [Acetobacteraceae bacterium]|nr:hypothetical protein [Acetobacteraceae bacterium]